MIATGHPYGRPRRQRWSFVSWWFSLILIVPLLGIFVTFAWGMLSSNTDIEGQVLDAYTGEPVADARIDNGESSTSTSSDGTFRLGSGDASSLSVSKDGYDTATYEISEDESDIEISLRPNTMSGTVTQRITDEPLAGVQVAAVVNGSTVSSVETDESGSFLLTDIPEDAEVMFTYQDFAEVVEPIEERTEISVSMRPSVLSGSILNENGEPIQWAMIAIEDAWTESDENGQFRLENAPEAGELVFKAPGYHAQVRELDDQLEMEVVLEEKPVRAIYVTAGTVGNEERFNELLDLVDQTELNAMVIDIKDSTGFVFHDTQVELAREIDAVRPQYDVVEVLEKLDERGIYAIARQVIFEDPVLAEARNDLAIRDSEGGLWQTWNGIVWLNAYEEEVWDYNIDLMMEAVELGFDEVQLDYMRFPSDGPLNRAEYGVEVHDTESRGDAITEYLARSHEAIMPTTAYLAGDIFGLALWEMGDGGIGQNLEKITPYLDYINPMIYPSHFFPGSMGFDIPNDHPYDVIYLSLQNGAERIPDFTPKLRPWLQDFSYGEGRSYGTQEVRDQIDATNDFGATGWMLWSPSNYYHEDALDPAE